MCKRSENSEIKRVLISLAAMATAVGVNQLVYAEENVATDAVTTNQVVEEREESSERNIVDLTEEKEEANAETTEAQDREESLVVDLTAEEAEEVETRDEAGENERPLADENVYDIGTNRNVHAKYDANTHTLIVGFKDNDAGITANFTATDLPGYIAAHKDDITKIVVRENVQSLGNNLFNGLDKVTEVRIESNEKLKSIGASTFSGCTALKTIAVSIEELAENDERRNKAVLPSSVETIGEAAFYKTGLVQFSVPEKVSRLEYHVLAQCPTLRFVDMPGSNLTYIGKQAFAEDPVLESVTFPNSVVKIDRAAFRADEGLTHVYGAGLEEIACDAFDRAFIAAPARGVDPDKEKKPTITTLPYSNAKNSTRDGKTVNVWKDYIGEINDYGTPWPAGLNKYTLTGELPSKLEIYGSLPDISLERDDNRLEIRLSYENTENGSKDVYFGASNQNSDLHFTIGEITEAKAERDGSLSYMISLTPDEANNDVGGLLIKSNDRQINVKDLKKIQIIKEKNMSGSLVVTTIRFIGIDWEIPVYKIETVVSSATRDNVIVNTSEDENVQTSDEPVETTGEENVQTSDENVQAGNETNDENTVNIEVTDPSSDTVSTGSEDTVSTTPEDTVSTSTDDTVSTTSDEPVSTSVDDTVAAVTPDEVVSNVDDTVAAPVDEEAVEAPVEEDDVVEAVVAPETSGKGSVNTGEGSEAVGFLASALIAAASFLGLKSKKRK